jgi:aspartate aminotransferase-like enzyme
MPSGEGTQRYEVVVHMRATGPAEPLAPDTVQALLRGAGSQVPWSSVQTSWTSVGNSIELRLATIAQNPGVAARLVVDAVRGLLGLDATFTTWVVDARKIAVIALDG